MLCPLCAMRSGAKMLKAYLDRLNVKYHKYNGLKAYLVTLTIKDGSDLLERFDHLQKSLRRYKVQRMNAIKGLMQSVEFNKALGAVGSFEFKRESGSSLWHPFMVIVFIANVTPFYDRE